jgi:hypothetical protein
MLQMSQIEKPRCSATIDQIRLRRAMNLPFCSQNFSSSGFHSDIQATDRDNARFAGVARAFCAVQNV